jgi:hypothetical protein
MKCEKYHVDVDGCDGDCDDCLLLVSIAPGPATEPEVPAK